MKMLGVILMLAFSTAMGFCFGKQQKEISKNSKLLLDAMIKARRILKYSKPEKNKLLQEIDFDKLLMLNNNSLLDNEMYVVAQAYFEEMGSKDFNSEVEALNYTISMLENRYNHVAKTCLQNQKLYFALGIIFGLLFVIVFI